MGIISVIPKITQPDCSQGEKKRYTIIMIVLIFARLDTQALKSIIIFQGKLNHFPPSQSYNIGNPILYGA